MSVRVLALLQRKFPGLRYRGWHAFYPGDKSEDYLDQCLAEAGKLGVRGLIDIDTRFLPIDEVQAHLSTVSAVLMPYDSSEEGGSAAANLALAARRPIVTSPSSIFRSVSDVVCSADRHAPEAYAELLDKILSEPDVSRELSDRASSWVEANSYNRAAQLFLNV
jgi:glycosyltransferase involved in cell wall biosynthesis